MKFRYTFLLMVFLVIMVPLANAQVTFSSRYSYYTTEKTAEMILTLPEALQNTSLHITLGINSKLLLSKDTTFSTNLKHESLNIKQNLSDIGHLTLNIESLKEGKYEVVLWIEKDSLSIERRAEILKLAPKANTVKIDRLKGSLLVNDRPWFPFGFYNYSPVQPTLAEEEVVKGFNMMSPYQTIDPKTIANRKTYMDRCDALGMKVHYQLISVAGGGGVGAKGQRGVTKEEKFRRLKFEVEAFKDHPALLAWYLSDEPTGHGADPDSLKLLYEFIKSIDPYHPITIVFMAPQRSRDYAGAMDIVMADPYPIPNSGVVGVGATTESLYQEFLYEKPVWIVPQAFGGNEHWGREPSPQEIRAMTYLSLVRGATGIQYFIRHGLNGFPKSNVTWGVCGRMAMEVAEIAPWLLQGTPIRDLWYETNGLWVAGWDLNGEVLVITVNTDNKPRPFGFKVPAQYEALNIEVPFEHRTLTADNGTVVDWLAPLGTQVYRTSSIQTEGGDGNLIEDPGFEDTYSCGVPAHCYVQVGKDRGATAFLDTREVAQGRHSLRLTTPADGEGLGLSFYRVRLNGGQSYRFSIKARPDTSTWRDPELSFWKRLFGKKTEVKRSFRIRIGSQADQVFSLEPGWHSYTFYFITPEMGSDQVEASVNLELTSRGTTWFDEMSLVEDPVIQQDVSAESRRMEVSLSTASADGILRFNLNGEQPTTSDPVYIGAFPVLRSTDVAAGIFMGDMLLGWTKKHFDLHKAIGHVPAYNIKKYYPRYSAGGDLGLVDGIHGTRNYTDGRWQGFNGQNMDVTIRFDTLTTLGRVSVGCLQDISSWIFMPLEFIVYKPRPLESLGDQETGRPGEGAWEELGSVYNDVSERQTGAIRKDYRIEFNPVNVMAIRVVAVNMKVCPDWHNGKGKAAFVFVDEVVVE